MTTSYTYDFSGIRVRESTGGTETRYLAMVVNPSGYVQTLEQWTGSNASPDVSYVWGSGQAPITQSRAGGSVSHFITDGLGSVRGLTNASQGVTDTLDYQAYGKVASRTGTTPLVYEFAGQHIDQRTGYSYNRARWLNREGHWISQDPMMFGPGEVGDANLYAYVGGNPVNGTDPTGNYSLTGLTVTMGIGASLGVIDGLLRGARGWALAGDAAIGAAFGAGGYAIFGASRAYSAIRLIQAAALGAGTGLGISGAYAAYLEENYKLAVFRGATTAIGTITGFAVMFRTSTPLQLAAAADQALQAVGAGRGGAWGARVHGEAARIIRGSGNNNLSVEVWYRNGRVLGNGDSKAGAIRLDVVEGNPWQPKAVYDYKFNTAALKQARVAEIQSHLPTGYQNIPIAEIRAPGN